MQKLIHLLIPRESNNHKAKILHPSGITVISLLLIFFQLTLNIIPKINPSVLGYASSISKEEVIRLTNEKRKQAGLSALVANNVLSNAAQAKGIDMIAKDYWAHVAPDGTQPWKFFGDYGYKYRYAGENLARDFSNANSAVEAWMDSPSHKENILNPKYKEIGIGVVEGDLAGSDTTIIVQFFGTKYVDAVNNPVVEAVKTEGISVIPEIAKPQIQVSPFSLTKKLSISVILALLLVFILDAFIVFRKNIIRITGRTFAHVSFLVVILAIMIVLNVGKII